MASLGDHFDHTMQNPTLGAGQLQGAPCTGCKAKLPASTSVLSEPGSGRAPIQHVQMEFGRTIKGPLSVFEQSMCSLLHDSIHM